MLGPIDAPDIGKICKIRDRSRVWLTAINRISDGRFTSMQSLAPTLCRKVTKNNFGAMANSIWTIEEFTCPGCSMNYTATREEHAEPHAGSFKCNICSGEVHSWSGKHHFFGWQAVKTKPAVFGRRWAGVG